MTNAFMLLIQTRRVDIQGGPKIGKILYVL